jgi:hypothetical protein
MRDEIADTIERMVARRDSLADIRQALNLLAAKWERQPSRTTAQREKRKYMLGRLGKILHYFHHGYEGSDPSDEDRRLVDLIDGLRRDENRT